MVSSTDLRGADRVSRDTVFITQTSLSPSSSGSSFTSSTSSLIPLLSPSSQVVLNSTAADESSSAAAAFGSSLVDDGHRVAVYLGQYRRPPYQDFVCGLGAAIFETSITYPLNKLIFRQQLHGITLRQSIAQLKQEGVRFLYRGLLFPLMQKGASRSLMFGMYDEYRRLLCCNHTMAMAATKGGGEITIDRPNNRFTACHASAAFLAGVTEALGLTPFERVQVLMQNAKYHAEFKNSVDALKRGLRPYGIREYYRGLSVIIIRNGSTSALFFAFRDPLKQLIAQRDRAGANEMSANRLLIASFCSGAVLGACLSTTFYPLNVIKSRMQSRLGGEFQKPWTVLVKILTEREFRATELYRGVTLNFSRSLLTWGLTNACYEFIQREVFGKGFAAAI